MVPGCGLYDFIRNQAADGAESGGLDARQSEVLASLESCNVPDNLVDVVVPHFIKLGILASTSPKVLQTESLPGYTL